MKEKITKFLKSKQTPKLLFIIGMAGILLIFASTFFGGEEEEKLPAAEVFDGAAYKQELENEVSGIVAALCGDGEAVVTVTLDSGPVYEYADQTKRNNAADSETTSEESERTYVTVRDANGGETPLLITSRLPKVRGVTVVCAYSDEECAERIKSAVTAALDINSRQIYIGRKIR